jgi:hypothetical protein
MADAMTPSRPVVRGLRGSVCSRPAARRACICQCARTVDVKCHVYNQNRYLLDKRYYYYSHLDHSVYQDKHPLVDLAANLLHTLLICFITLSLQQEGRPELMLGG